MALVRFRNHGDLAPWSALREMERELSRVFTDYYGENADLFNSAWVPQVDLSETENEYVLQADLPGLRREDVELVCVDNTVNLKGERRHETKEETSGYHRTERRYGAFQRSFEIPGGFEPDKVTASFEDGVLTVHLPKKEESKPKQIKVDVK